MYNNIIEEITFEQVKEKCMKGEIDINSSIDKVCVVNYLGGTAESQAEYLLNSFIENDIAFMVEINPSKLFNKIYSVKDHNDNIDIIAIFNNNIIDIEKLMEVYEETADEFTIASYLEFQEQLNAIKKPQTVVEYEIETGKIIKQYTDGEMSFKDMFKEFGLEMHCSNDKILDVADKLIKDQMTEEELQSMNNSGELNKTDLMEISAILEIFKKISQ